MNKLLLRQIKKFLGDADAVPQTFESLFNAISDAYDGFDTDRTLIERTLDISSNELTETNQKLSQEVGERKEAQEKLRETNSLLTATLESTADGILVIDLKGRIVSYNRKFLHLWSIHESVLESRDDKKLFEFVLDQLMDPESFRVEVQRLYTFIKDGSFDILKFKDGRIFEWFSQPQKIDDRIVGRVWSFHDITERKKLEQHQARLLRQLEKTNKELNDLVYVISHDLKTPLRGINTLVNWLSADYADKFDDEGKEQTELLLSRVIRMYNLIDGILQYSGLERVMEEKTMVNLGELVANIIDKLAVPGNITITIEDELPVIECEKGRISQIFQNLLSNAVRYMDKSQGQINVKCVEEESYWKFSVTDNGPGIEEKYFEKIFQMFQTLSPKDEIEGTGVGLTVVRKIVEIYGGRIWVKSKLGEGSTFFFTLSKYEVGVKSEKLEECFAY